MISAFQVYYFYLLMVPIFNLKQLMVKVYGDQIVSNVYLVMFDDPMLQTIFCTAMNADAPSNYLASLASVEVLTIIKTNNKNMLD